MVAVRVVKDQIPLVPVRSIGTANHSRLVLVEVDVERVRTRQDSRKRGAGSLQVKSSLLVN